MVLDFRDEKVALESGNGLHSISMIDEIIEQSSNSGQLWDRLLLSFGATES